MNLDSIRREWNQARQQHLHRFHLPKPGDSVSGGSPVFSKEQGLDGARNRVSLASLCSTNSFSYRHKVIRDLLSYPVYMNCFIMTLCQSFISCKEVVTRVNVGTLASTAFRLKVAVPTPSSCAQRSLPMRVSELRST